MLVVGVTLLWVWGVDDLERGGEGGRDVLGGLGGRMSAGRVGRMGRVVFERNGCVGWD